MLCSTTDGIAGEEIGNLMVLQLMMHLVDENLAHSKAEIPAMHTSPSWAGEVEAVAGQE